MSTDVEDAEKRKTEVPHEVSLTCNQKKRSFEIVKSTHLVCASSQLHCRHGLVIFGKDVSKIPCFKQTYLYGIYGGLGSGLLYFLLTSNTTKASNVGVGTFSTIVLTYWFYCRYQWSKRNFEYQKLKYCMQQNALYEGSELEQQLSKFAEELDKDDKS